MDAEHAELASYLNEIGFSGNVDKAARKEWQEAWYEAKKTGAINDKDFWRTLNRERSRRLGGNVFVTGVAEVDAALAGFIPATRKRLIVSATKTIAKKVKDDAVAKAPHATGAMRDAIKVVTLRQRKRRLANWAKRQIGASLAVGGKLFKGDQFYGGFIEFGTEDRRTKSGKFLGRILPMKFAFLRPALYANRGYAVSAFADAVRKAIADLRLRTWKKENPNIVKAEREAATAAKATARAERLASQATAKAARSAARLERTNEMLSKAKARGQAMLAAARQKQAVRMQKHDFRMRKKAQSAARARMRRAAKSIY